MLNHANGAAPASDADISAVLAEVGLDRLSSSLDRSARWEHELGDDEQRLLAFARLALRQPKWVIIDEALDAFDGPDAEAGAVDAGEASRRCRDPQHRPRPAQHSILSTLIDDRERYGRVASQAGHCQGWCDRATADRCCPSKEVARLIYLACAPATPLAASTDTMDVELVLASCSISSQIGCEGYGPAADGSHCARSMRPAALVIEEPALGYLRGQQIECGDGDEPDKHGQRQRHEAELRGEGHVGYDDRDNRDSQCKPGKQGAGTARPERLVRAHDEHDGELCQQ